MSARWKPIWRWRCAWMRKPCCGRICGFSPCRRRWMGHAFPRSWLRPSWKVLGACIRWMFATPSAIFPIPVTCPMRWRGPSAPRWRTRRATYWLFFPAWARSAAPKLRSRASTHWCCLCMATCPPRRRTWRCGLPNDAAWCWLPPLRKPRSPCLACALSLMAAFAAPPVSMRRVA